MNFIFLKNKDKMSFFCTGGSFIDEGSNDVKQFQEYLKSKGEFKNLLDEEKNEIYRWMEDMTDEEANVFRLYFGIGGETSNTLSYLQERFNLSPERMKQIKEKALKRLKEKKDNPDSDTSKNDVAE